jgi:hypothetical protein
MRLSLELKQNAEQVSHAVDAYIDHCVSELAVIQDDKSLQDQVRDTLRRKANGMFLWVSLVINEPSEVEKCEVLEVVDEIPTDLDKVYVGMLELIQRLKRGNPERRRLVLSTITAAYRPVRLQELGVLSGLPGDISGKKQSVARVVKMCGTFLTIQDDNVYIIHQSAKDYLFTNALHTIFPSGTADTYHRMFSASIQEMSRTLRRDIYDLGAAEFPIDQVIQPEPEPLAAARYSCVYWVDHLCDSSGSTKIYGNLQDRATVGEFVRKKYIYWLEALSLLRSIAEGDTCRSKT